MKNKWKVIYECDEDDGTPTCWARQINDPVYGAYIWISLSGDKEKPYHVEVDAGGDDFKILCKCKSLASAKRWVSMKFGK